ncbi:bifunctional DNA-binding transcriptional regulator/O6-methylguanine-DNA methyltransferase Ada [Opitutaceae bacterium EW11]|nr:bifunctional DNA-binding transcriptional regulator/O6-methylguanine-DNA methyltransferase Ada [Opitutaceae bacterium EW11]
MPRKLTDRSTAPAASNAGTAGVPRATEKRAGRGSEVPGSAAPGSYATDDARWEAVTGRDARADGRFVYSVSSTGVYCRPSCASRQPRRENVRFHENCAAAEAAGFRACKRCQPNGVSPADLDAARMAEACRRIEAAETPPNPVELARAAGLSRFHFHRLFKRVVGVTPGQFFARTRAERMKEELRRSSTVTQAIYDAGFQSSSRFYDASDKALGMTPTQFRDGGAGLAVRYATAPCSLGYVLVAATERGICAVFLGDTPHSLEAQLREEFPRALLQAGAAGLSDWLRAVVKEVERPGGKFQLPLDVRGTVFQQRVWEALRRIPAGETATYSEIAAAIGAPSAVRAVASACASNRLAVLVPCHRAVRIGGALSGYRWGVERKKTLLQRERTDGSAG